MRESNFSFPVQNKACIVLTSAFYDRRALDCTSTLPLINSLSHLAFLTSTSPRIREILSVDGGLERLIFLLKTPRGKDPKSIWLWTLVFQCLVNIGVRGSESIRTRVVEADIVPIVASILQHFHSALELALAERGKDKRFMRELSHQRAAIAPPPSRNTDPEMLLRVPLQPVPMRRVSSTIAPPNRQTAIADPLPPAVRATIRRHHSNTSVSSDDSRSVTPTRAQTPTDDLQSATASLNIDGSLGRSIHSRSNLLQIRPVLRHQSSTVSAADSDDGNSDDVASTIGDTAIHELAIHDSIDGRLVLSDDEAAPLTVLPHSIDQIAGETNQLTTTQSITIARPLEIQHGQTTIGGTIRSPSDTFIRPTIGATLTGNSSQVEYKSTSLPREEDIISALQLFAYISKYPNLRTYFAESYYINDLFSSSSCPSFDKQHQVSCNIFSLVEKFTLRIHPQEVQYWAGVIMRNACRKDESRGGIRQCANMKCGKWEEYSRQFAKCRRCRRTKYCSKSCQSQAWPGHRWWCVQRNEDRNESANHVATEIQPH